MRGKRWLGSIVGTLVIGTVLYVIGRRQATVPVRPTPPTPGLAVSVTAADKCATCHHRTTPTIVEQWSRSLHAVQGVRCSDCHEVRADYPTAREHFGTFVSPVVTPSTCARCHVIEARQYWRSRHSLPAWTALVGYAALPEPLKAQFEEIEEVRRAPEGGELPTGFVGAVRNALYDLEGPAVTRLACEGCHQIGKPNPDGSAGNCNMCHLRHEFSLEQVRKPETCNRCHIGPDHPQWEIYEESSHGILYHTRSHEWNWSQRPGRLTVRDFPAPTCQVCHMSGLGPQPTTHDVGDRLSYFLFAEVSTRRPNWRENRERMVQVCLQCHSRPFIEEEYRKADAVTEAVNAWVQEARAILEGLVRDGLLSDKPFHHPIQFVAFDLWHYYGRTAKFGAYMQGPDYVQWHGIYPLLSKLAELRHMAEEMRRSAGRPALR
jgi:hypothetical protein